jgi:mannose-6-phosphate isomerase-like protein (cupin superfamily)
VADNAQPRCVQLSRITFNRYLTSIARAQFTLSQAGTNDLCVAKETWASVARCIAASLETMTVQNLSAQPPFITKDGSTIRSILDRTNAPVQSQSLAEARVRPGGRTKRHYHKIAEELYFILEGAGEIELDGERRLVGPGDAILIPPGAWHTIMATEPLRFLCCCAPPYSHEDTYFE